jgi:hypothetical protein
MMCSCPYCSDEYSSYRIIGLETVDASGIEWSDEKVPLALLFCRTCGRATLMHPDHPEVQRMHAEAPIEQSGQNIRTLNVSLADVGDETLRHSFEKGRPE